MSAESLGPLAIKSAGVSVKIDDILGQRDWKTTPRIQGRILLDMLYFVRKEYPELKGPGATTLGAVASHFLGQSKEDVSIHMMSQLQNGDENSRRDLAIYCLKVVNSESLHSLSFTYLFFRMHTFLSSLWINLMD